MPTDAEAVRRARRRWVRDHHPDRGGDPALFVTGLAQLDERPRPVVVTVRRRRSRLRRAADLLLRTPRAPRVR